MSAGCPMTTAISLTCPSTRLVRDWAVKQQYHARLTDLASECARGHLLCFWMWLTMTGLRPGFITMVFERAEYTALLVFLVYGS